MIYLGLGSSILFAAPELATIAGVQGVVVYGLMCALPLLIFSALGPIVRRKCPEGFIFTEWTRQRYGVVTALWLSFLTMITMFLYMVSELSAIGQVVNTLTGLDSLPILVVQCVVTTIYTSIGGFKVSFLTDNIQGSMTLGLVLIATITVGAKTKIQPDLIERSGLLEQSVLGWQLIYILPVAILTNDFFLSNFWLRTFASKTDRDLWIGVSIAAVCVLIIMVLVGITGCIAAWSGAWPGNPPQEGSVAFFLLLEQLPNWVVGIVLVMAVSLSTSSFDSLQSAMVSTASNDLFRNRLNIWLIRLAVVMLMIPTIVIALKAVSILRIFLISDLLSASTIPVLTVGLHDGLYWWRGFEVVVGGLGGILSVFIFGTIYYGSAQAGANLIILSNGLYASDWGAFGAFVCAPVGGLLFGSAACALRLAVQFCWAKKRGTRFTGFDRPAVEDGNTSTDAVVHQREDVAVSKRTGHFF